MAKSNFFKKYSKPLALLAILIILSSVLFSSYNNSTKETELQLSNFVEQKPKLKY